MQLKITQPNNFLFTFGGKVILVIVWRRKGEKEVVIINIMGLLWEEEEEEIGKTSVICFYIPTCTWCWLCTPHVTYICNGMCTMNVKSHTKNYKFAFP